MKRGWLRGVLLGVSLALLLVGGVALAQGFFVEADQECFECWPGPGGPTEEYILWVTLGWEEACRYCFEVDYPTGSQLNCFDLPDDGTTQVGFAFSCSGAASIEVPPEFGEIELASPLDGIEELYGEWTFRWWQDDCSGLSDEVTVIFADDCFVAMHVPEPGTIVLLGSGLAGLAGYASLRLRARRKREE